MWHTKMTKYSTVYLCYFSSHINLPSRRLLFCRAGSHWFQAQSDISSAWLTCSSHDAVVLHLALKSDSAPQNQWKGVWWDSQLDVSWWSPSFQSSAAASGRVLGQTATTTFSIQRLIYPKYWSSSISSIDTILLNSLLERQLLLI